MSTTPSTEFGINIRERRLLLLATDQRYSVRQLAQRIGVGRAYLSKVEHGTQPPPSEEKIRRLAKELQEDPDLLLALAGKVSSDLQAIIRRRPLLFAQLIREVDRLPDSAALMLVREFRGGRLRPCPEEASSGDT